MHPPQSAEYTLVIFHSSTTRSRQKHIAGDETACLPCFLTQSRFEIERRDDPIHGDRD